MSGFMEVAGADLCGRPRRFPGEGMKVRVCLWALEGEKVIIRWKDMSFALGCVAPMWATFAGAARELPAEVADRPDAEAVLAYPRAMRKKWIRAGRLLIARARIAACGNV